MVEMIHKEDKYLPSEGDESKKDKIVPGANPCANHFCGWGKECKLNEKGKPTCHCATECPQGPIPDPLDRVMRDLKKRQELYGDQWIQLIEEAERDDHLKHVYPVIWKYCDLDNKPHDKHVSHHELIPLTAPVIPLESCIEPFLRSCDTDSDEKITLKEWGKCLGLEENEIFERC
ncbi:EGF like subdomain protein [Trichuris suis]|nr:EGF like subdomain protein [Trichuris suis]